MFCGFRCFSVLSSLETVTVPFTKDLSVLLITFDVAIGGYQISWGVANPAGPIGWVVLFYIDLVNPCGIW